MVNQLRQGNNDLFRLDYSELLEQILAALQNKNLSLGKIHSSENHKENYNRLILEIDQIADHIAQQSIIDPLGGTAFPTRAATLNFLPSFEQDFPQILKEIQTQLKHRLQTVIQSSPQEFIASLKQPLHTFNCQDAGLDLTYNFDQLINLQKQRLTLNTDASSEDKLLKFHRLRIKVKNTHQFDENVLNGLSNYIESKFTNEEEQEELQELLESYQNQDNSELDKLRNLVNQESIGKLKKQAQIDYIEFLCNHINSQNQKLTEDQVYLEVLLKRLNKLDEFLNQVRPEADYDVSYAGCSVNYQDIFAREDAFQQLPIIPIITGFLAETRNEQEGTIEFTYGIKLKLNGSVNKEQGQSSFEYYLDLLNPDSERHKEAIKNDSKKRLILKVLCLYYFVFACDKNDPSPQGDLKYDPIVSFQENILPKLRTNDTDVQKILRGVLKGFERFKVQEKINTLRNILLRTLKYRTPFLDREYPAHLVIKNSILYSSYDEIYDKYRFFKDINNKQSLKYIFLEGVGISDNAFLTIPVEIVIDDLHYFRTPDIQEFNMQYDVNFLKYTNTLPIAFIEKEDNCRNTYSETLKKRNLIVLPYNKNKSHLSKTQFFFYQFTFALLTFLILKLLLEQEKDSIFVPIMRLETTGSNETNIAPNATFIYHFSKVLAHLLNEEHYSNSQGFDVRKRNSFKIRNAMSSLYSVIPKTFKFKTPSDQPQLDKLAILIVSSRESDAGYKKEEKFSNLMGEVIGINKQADGKIQLKLIQTFSDNYNKHTLFREPRIIQDVVNSLYTTYNYRHIVYVAKAPYTSTLHLTAAEEDDDLFFMSREIIQSLKQDYNDLKIYPMFFDKYYVFPFVKNLKQSLYIQDAVELTRLVNDENKRSVVFFNLFNGIKVGNQEDERHYRGVISYSTLLNFYQGILGDQDIYEGLIYEGSLKQDILQYLTLFHFSRYEQHSSKINLKLDPYQNLIGDSSVGKRSLLTHTHERVKFNVLAFLTEVQNILYKDAE